MSPKALRFDIIRECSTSKARAGLLTLPHGYVETPVFMPVDDVVHSLTPLQRVEEAMWRSIRWLDRCIEANKHSEKQSLYAIVQGGLSEKLRTICCLEMMKRETPGIAIGGLSGGEEKSQTCKIISICTNLLPSNKPRYLMGVGYTEDLIVSVALGIDQFDCVYPTRTARFGNALTPYGVLNLRNKYFANNYTPIDRYCKCPC
ncbi:hypothetical protein PCK2_000522, partial [Pneumocystis canis]